MKTLSSRDEPSTRELKIIVGTAAERLIELHEGLKALGDTVRQLDPVSLALKQHDICDLIDKLAKRATEV
jgi:hypothetical protein